MYLFKYSTVRVGDDVVVTEAVSLVVVVVVFAVVVVNKVSSSSDWSNVVDVITVVRGADATATAVASQTTSIIVGVVARDMVGQQ